MQQSLLLCGIAWTQQQEAVLRRVGVFVVLRYPADPNPAHLGEKKPEDTPLSRVLRTVSGFWKACGRRECTPIDGMTIMAYDAFQKH